MSYWSIKIKNTTSNKIKIDRGITFEPDETIESYEGEDFCLSENIRNYLIDGDLIIYDKNDNILSSDQALDYVQLATIYDLKKSLGIY